jgi:hypothetical protein
MTRFVIDRRHDTHHDRDVWCVWQVVDGGEPLLLGEYDSPASAEASLAEHPRASSDVSWAYLEDPPSDDAEDER